MSDDLIERLARFASAVNASHYEWSDDDQEQLLKDAAVELRSLRRERDILAGALNEECRACCAGAEYVTDYYRCYCSTHLPDDERDDAVRL